MYTFIATGLQLTTKAPKGGHDGCWKGKRYFQCARGWGVILRASQIVGPNFEELGGTVRAQRISLSTSR